MASLRPLLTGLLIRPATSSIHKRARLPCQVVATARCPLSSGWNHQGRTSSFSSTTSSTSGTGWFSGWTDERNRKTFIEQMEDMGKVEKFTLGAYHDGLAKQTDSWKASMPGIRSSTEVVKAKQTKLIVERLVSLVGRDAVVADLNEALSHNKLEKIKVANECDITLETLDAELMAFEMTIQTHRLIQLLQKQGKPVPNNPDEMKTLMQTYARQLLTPEEKKTMETRMKKVFRSEMRGQFSRR
ncbi:expressed unknown protein [Seminavis robusta]|uniref:Uncharacterized protein n=1 Tax=Seminavis robusta TaxID=568900 RepID=A0A9N8E557_9STRA|nr:expressed unknown protein [Seminavis robusta]|eukprot:Sro628_g178070.1 n/a (243) ;mRNA; r:30276-31004